MAGADDSDIAQVGVAIEDGEAFGADLRLVGWGNEGAIVFAQEIGGFGFVLAVHLFVEGDVEAGVLGGANHDAKDEEAMHLEHDFDLQGLLLYQAGPGLERDILFAVFI